MSNAENIQIGNRLRAFGEKNFSSMAEFARALDIAPQNMNGLLNGSRSIGKNLLKKLDSLGCNNQWLLFGNYPQNSELPSDAKESETPSMYFSMPGHISPEMSKRLREFVNKIAQAPGHDQELILKIADDVLNQKK